MPFCYGCGRHLPTDAKFCDACGGALKATLEAKIADLEARLAQCVPKSEAEAFRARVTELESELNESIPKVDAEAKIRQLEETQIDLRADMKKLEEKLAQSVPKIEADNLKTRIQELEARLSESVPKVESESKIREAEAKIQELEAKLESKLAEYAVPAATIQTSVQGKICSSCGFRNPFYAENFCVKCGRRLEEISV